MGCLYIHAIMSKDATVPPLIYRDTLHIYKNIAAIYRKKSSFLSFHSLLFLVKNTGEVIG